MNEIALGAFGAVGALIYAFPVYLAAVSNEPPTRFALAVMLFSVFVGAIVSPALVPMLGAKWPFLIDPKPYPLAIAVGLGCNPIMPIFVRKLTGWAETLNPPGGAKR